MGASSSRRDLERTNTLSSRWIDLLEVCDQTRLSRRTIATERNAGRFPTPLNFGRRVVFVREEVETWMARREAERGRRLATREAGIA